MLIHLVRTEEEKSEVFLSKYDALNAIEMIVKLFCIPTRKIEPSKAAKLIFNYFGDNPEIRNYLFYNFLSH